MVVSVRVVVGRKGIKSLGILEGMGELYSAINTFHYMGACHFRWTLDEEITADFVEQFREDVEGYDFVTYVDAFVDRKKVRR